MLEIHVDAFANSSVGVICDGQRVYASNFGTNPAEVLESLQRMLPSTVAFRVSPKPSVFAKRALSVIRDICEGKEAVEILPLALERFPTYRQRVLRAVSQIPVGYVASYGGVADAAGGGARAVGNAMATNCLAPLVPCHRVVTSNLGLGGYGGGLKVKYDFLVREKRGYAESHEVIFEGRVLRVFPVEFVLRRLEKFASKGMFQSL